MHNIQVVDNIVQETEKLFSSFYGEDESNTQTAFVFTADHGMSVIGNHGDGRKFFSFPSFQPSHHVHI